MIIGAKDSFLGLLNPKVKQLAGGVATEQEDLKAAGETHAKEARDFIAGEKEAEISASQAQIETKTHEKADKDEKDAHASIAHCR